MKKIFSIGAATFCAALSCAQMSNNFWYFGQNVGLDFSGGNPVFTGGSALNTNEGTAVQSDSITGARLFYSDGIRVWNRLHALMPNGSGLMGDASSAQSALVIPRPATANRYYLFTTPVQNNANGCRYSEIDMTLSGGNGDVLLGNKNTLLFGPPCEQQTAVKHCNNYDYWYISHQFGTNNFYAYQVTSGGILGPVISSVGAVLNGGGTTGQLKASPDGRKLAFATNFQNVEQYFDFDNTTGVVSNAGTLNSGQGYGVSFSPDNTRLYIGILPSRQVYQFDMTQPTNALVNASMTLVGSDGGTYTMGSLQLGRNGRLYCSRWGQNYLVEIPNPNNLAPACGWTAPGVSWGGGQCQLGLPNFPENLFNAGPPCLPLEVELLAFTAAWQGQEDALLRWRTASEKDVDYFTIERSVAGGIFRDLHTAKATGNSSTEQAYAHVDNQPPAGDLRYRLRITDVDGDVELSDIVVLKRGPAPFGVKAYPNPALEILFFEGEAGEARTVTVQLLDITGKLCVQQELQVNPGFYRAEVPLHALPPGFYIARVSDSETGTLLLHEKVQKL